MRDISADDRHAVASSDIGQAAIKVPQPFDLHILAHGQGDDGRAGASPHGGDVTEADCQRFMPDGFGLISRFKMHIGHQGIG